MSKRAILLVSTDAVESQEAEYNEWYTNTHIPQILERVPGYVGAKRYKVNDDSPANPGQNYLAIYEIEADDPGAAVKELMAAVVGGKLDATTAIDRNKIAPFVLYDLL